MSWVVIYTKPRQEVRAKENLQSLGLQVASPLIPIEKVIGGTVSTSLVSLFPRYIFVRSDAAIFENVCHMIRNVRGVSQIVKFGGKFAELKDKTFQGILRYEKALSSNPKKAYQSGERVVFTHEAFREIQAVYQESDGQERVILLFDLLTKPVKISVPVSAVKKCL